MPELLSAIELLKPPEGHSAQKMGGRRDLNPRPPYLTCGIRCHRLAGRAAIAPLSPAPSVATSGPEPGPNFEQVFGANTESFSRLNTI